TRSQDGNLLPFKKGGFMIALETGATIVPIGIRGAQNIVEHKTFNIKMGQHAAVHIGKPIDASRYTLEQRDQLMADVKAAIAEAAGLK
ncbi:MAG: plsC, partial [Gammaproteobacteria bacterium]|nr:plsC [Gammaproteobacteria bacterium]